MPRSPRCAILVACSLLAVTAAPVGHAQPLDLTFFRPIGSSSALTLESPVPARVTELELALAMDYAHALLERRVACPASASSPDPACVLGNADGRTQVVPDMLQLDLIAALALADAVRLSAALPLVLTRAADDLQAPQEMRNTFGTGDLRLALTAPLLRGAWPLALAFESTFPTARDRVLAGVHGVSVTPALVAAHAFGRVTLSAKLGYRLMRRNHVLGHEQDDALVLGFGASYELLRELRAIAELRAQLGIGGRRFDAQERPMELDLGLAVPGPADTSVVLGAGAGAWPGHDGIGAPGYRLFAAISGKLALGNECASDAPCAAVGPDADRDGVPDARDTCPNDAEDRDGFADDDGCPDLDNDADGLPDARDTCPTHSEDRDGYQDTDGCPEPDNDGDGIADGRDLCRLDPE
ncbi:MAG TPA: transporter, partial [Polyangiales bacterium]|nr:transporter [Polyangiales bacterium]